MSIFDLVSWWFWLVALLGSFGAIALIIFAPALAMTLWQAFTRIVLAVLRTRIGCALLAAAIALPIGYLHGGKLATDKCNAREAHAEEAARQRDVKQGELSAADVEKRNAELEARHNEDKEQLDAYKHALETRPANPSCALTPADLPRRR